jgi:choice-of-anchor A domain-containing protein
LKYGGVGIGLIVGLVIFGDVPLANQINQPNCPLPPSPPSPPSDQLLCPYFETDCGGLDFPLSEVVASFRDFNLVSFGNFTASTGDVQGRLAVQQNLNLGAGYSIGYEIQTGSGKDNYVPYSLVVGYNANFVSGAVYPDGSNFPYPGQEEEIFVGGTFTGAAYLASRVLGNCGDSQGCLDTYFNAAHSCYNSYQNNLAGVPTNVQVATNWSALVLTCNDDTDDSYSVTITAEDFAESTYWVVNNCNFQATWVINIVGTEDITFHGDNFPGVSGGVVYNVLGSGRTINVQTTVEGSILAPNNDLYQTGGFISGKVVVGNVQFALQINKPDCPNPSSVTINDNTQINSPSGSNTIYLSAGTGIRTGDDVTVGTETNTVTDVATDGTVTLAQPLSNAYPQGTKVTTVVNNPTFSRVYTNTQNLASSANALSAFFAFIAVLALFI